jgi:hypothetical protein
LLARTNETVVELSDVLVCKHFSCLIREREIAGSMKGRASKLSLVLDGKMSGSWS